METEHIQSLFSHLIFEGKYPSTRTHTHQAICSVSISRTEQETQQENREQDVSLPCAINIKWHSNIIYVSSNWNDFSNVHTEYQQPNNAKPTQCWMVLFHWLHFCCFILGFFLLLKHKICLSSTLSIQPALVPFSISSISLSLFLFFVYFIFQCAKIAKVSCVKIISVQNLCSRSPFVWHFISPFF